MFQQSPNVSPQSGPRFKLTSDNATGICRVCGAEYIVFQENPTFERERLNGQCGSEECYCQNLVRLRIKGFNPPYAVLRVPTEQKNLAKKIGEHKPQAMVSAERQRRLDQVRQLWDDGRTPAEITKRLGLKHQLVYHDLRTLGIDPKQSTQATAAADSKGRLLSRIKELIEAGYEFQHIAPIVGTSPAMVGHYARKYLNIDGRSRQASRRKQTAAQGIEP